MHLDVHLFSSEKVKGVSKRRQKKNSGGRFLFNATRGALVLQAKKLKAFLSGNLKGISNRKS